MGRERLWVSSLKDGTDHKLLRKKQTIVSNGNWKVSISRAKP